MVSCPRCSLHSEVASRNAVPNPKPATDGGNSGLLALALLDGPAGIEVGAELGDRLAGPNTNTGIGRRPAVARRTSAPLVLAKLTFWASSRVATTMPTT